MLPRPLPLLFAALAATLATAACAQTTAAPPAVASVPAPIHDPQLARVREALDAAERGGFDAAQYTDLSRHPLYGWIEYAGLRRNIDTLSNAQAQSILARYGDQAAGNALQIGRASCREREL